jgi:hypothetical protein
LGNGIRNKPARSYWVTNKDKIAKIAKITNVKRLGIIAASEQLDHWYDPCGKGGWEFDRILKPVAAAALKRIVELHKLDGRV